MKKANNKQQTSKTSKTPKTSKKQTDTDDSNKQTKLKLLDEHILVLMKKLVELQSQRCELTGMETASRQSPGSMLDGPTAARLMGVSQ